MIGLARPAAKGLPQENKNFFSLPGTLVLLYLFPRNASLVLLLDRQAPLGHTKFGLPPKIPIDLIGHPTKLLNRKEGDDGTKITTIAKPLSL